MNDPIQIPRKRERPPAPFVDQPPRPHISPTWSSIRVDLAEIIQHFDRLENELEQLRHGKLVNEIQLEGGVIIRFERMPREELVLAKLNELHDVRDQLDRAQLAIGEKVAALSARDVGPRRLPPPSKPKPASDEILKRMEADLIDVTAPKLAKPPVNEVPATRIRNAKRWWQR